METMKLFLKQNNLKLDTPISGLVYISFERTNNEIVSTIPMNKFNRGGA